MAGGGRTLVVNLVADTSKFGGKLKTAADDVGGLKGAIGKLGSMAGPALAAAGAAAGAFALKLGVDGVQAAAEEAGAISRLSKVLQNLGIAYNTGAIEEWISSQQKALGVSDTLIRNGFQRLVTSTKDVEEAQKLMSLAMDVSAATGKPLETVVTALGKAADGSNGAIGKLGVGIDAAALKEMSLAEVTAALSDRFAGSATDKAATYEGQVARLTEAFGELQESFGAGFLQGLGSAESATGSLTSSMGEMQPVLQDLGKDVGDLAAEIIPLVDLVNSLYDISQKYGEMKNGLPDWLQGLIHMVENAINPLQALIDHLTGLKKKAEELGILDPGFDTTATNDFTNSGSGGGSYGNTGKPNSKNPASENSAVRRSAPLDKGTPQIVIQAGIGDPVAIAREVERVLRLQDTRLGPS